MKNIILFIAHIKIFLIFFLITSCNKEKNDKTANGNFSQIDNKKIENNKKELTSLGVNSHTDSTNQQIFHTETLNGWLKESINEQIILKRIGEPDIKGKEELCEAIGTYVQEWEYKHLGIVLDMESGEKGEIKKILNITIQHPCTYTTSQKIGIGSDINLLKERYSELINETFSNNEYIVVGSIYGGVIFYVQNDFVYKIFIGAAAE